VAQKKALSVSLGDRRSWLHAECTTVSIVQRCALVGLARSTHYYEPMPEREENLMLMRLIDALFLKRPFYGVPRITDWLRTLGHEVNHKRVARLMRLMNLRAVVPGPHTSPPRPIPTVYPYLLRDLVVDRPNYVWCAAITYVPMRRGFLYLVAVLDWYSRYVLAWALSNTLAARFCLEAVDQAGERPAPDLQHRPRRAIYRRSLHGATGRGQDPDQHGWARSGAGQRLCGAALAECEVRGGLSAGLRRRSGGLAGVASLLCVL
jgi:putative transposase